MTSYQERASVENDERLAMKRGGMLPPLPQRVIREFEAIKHYTIFLIELGQDAP